MMRGYSLLEVIVAVFVLTGLVMAAFSIFENGGQQTIKVQNIMVASRLAQEICEDLHAMKTSDVNAQYGVPFNPPFSQYLYSVQPMPFVDNSPLNIQTLLAVSVTVTGPITGSANQIANASVTTLLGREPYPP